MKNFNNVSVFDHPDQASFAAAQDVFAWFKQQKKALNIVLATGRTPLVFYKNCIELYAKNIDLLKRSFFFNLDEYIGYAQDNPYSFSYFLNQNVIHPLGLTSEHYKFWDGASSNIEKHIDQHEAFIESRGGLDLVILGLGKNGHIAFNEPETNFLSESHVVQLSQETLEANHEMLDPKLSKPKHAVTMGIASIMSAKKIIVLAYGKEKAEAFRDALMKTPSEACPASALQRHSNCHFFIDTNLKNKLNLK